jgi:hypothetical protein
MFERLCGRLSLSLIQRKARQGFRRDVNFKWVARYSSVNTEILRSPSFCAMKRKRSRLSAVAKKAVKKVSNSRKRIEPALGRKTK